MWFAIKKKLYASIKIVSLITAVSKWHKNTPGDTGQFGYEATKKKQQQEQQQKKELDLNYDAVCLRHPA